MVFARAVQIFAVPPAAVEGPTRRSASVARRNVAPFGALILRPGADRVRGERRGAATPLAPRPVVHADELQRPGN